MKLFFFLFFCLAWLGVIPRSFAGQACDASAYIIDEDPKGTNVRAKPDGSSKVVHIIAHDKGIFNLEGGIVVSLAESDRGWIRISGYHNVEGNGKKITGWINGRLLATNYRTGNLYQAPTWSSKSQPLPKLADKLFFRVLGCKGDWVQVETIRPDPEFVKSLSDPLYNEYPKNIEFYQRLLERKSPLTGWLPDEGHCPSPVTTCP